MFDMESLKEMPWKDKEKWFDDMAEAVTFSPLQGDEHYYKKKAPQRGAKNQ